MSDELLERLRALDPVTTERIDREARALGALASRIVAGSPAG
jgi:hypothetical protein